MFHSLPPTYFNPRSPWGERLRDKVESVNGMNFNPRSPWGERRGIGILWIPSLPFQSTLPVGGATSRVSIKKNNERISIHAPRGGSDLTWSCTTAPFCKISIHAPRGGSDMSAMASLSTGFYFNPRSPWGERPCFFGWQTHSL